MARLILINGQAGAGKSTTARTLLHMLQPAAYIPTDSLISVEPFEWNDGLLELGIRNAALLIRSFADASYHYILLCGLIHDQQALDRFCTTVGSDHQLLYVWLRASQAVRNQRRVHRARDNADQPEHFDVVDRLLPDLTIPLHVPNGDFLALDTSALTPVEVAEHVRGYIRI